MEYRRGRISQYYSRGGRPASLTRLKARSHPRRFTDKRSDKIFGEFGSGCLTQEKISVLIRALDSAPSNIHLTAASRGYSSRPSATESRNRQRGRPIPAAAGA